MNRFTPTLPSFHATPALKRSTSLSSVLKATNVATGGPTFTTSRATQTSPSPSPSQPAPRRPSPSSSPRQWPSMQQFGVSGREPRDGPSVGGSRDAEPKPSSGLPPSLDLDLDLDLGFDFDLDALDPAVDDDPVFKELLQWLHRSPSPAANDGAAATASSASTKRCGEPSPKPGPDGGARAVKRARGDAARGNEAAQPARGSILARPTQPIVDARELRLQRFKNDLKSIPYARLERLPQTIVRNDVEALFAEYGMKVDEQVVSTAVLNCVYDRYIQAVCQDAEDTVFVKEHQVRAHFNALTDHQKQQIRSLQDLALSIKTHLKKPSSYVLLHRFVINHPIWQDLPVRRYGAAGTRA